MIRYIACLSFLLASPQLFSQELDCEVTVNTQQLTSEALDNLTDFAPQIKQYINGTRWTGDDFGGDRIKCTFNIYVLGSPSEGKYVAQVFIGSQRKIWNLKTKQPIERSTATIRIFDDKWEFSYSRGVQFSRNDYRFDPLTSFINFYVYLILGFDYDSYEQSSGNTHFQKALDIFNMARSTTSKGWEFPGSKTYSRTQFIDEIMSPRFSEFREAYYNYHSEGLDRLAKNRSKGLTNIITAVDKIGSLKKKINRPSMLLKTFFDTKYLELCDLFLEYADASVYTTFGVIDPSHQKSYQEYKQKRK